jgi:hypothetical protein
MPSRQKSVDHLSALAILVAFGGLFLGRLMIYPVATATGKFLERVAAQSEAWDWGHRVMLVGMVAVAPAAIALCRVMRAQSPRLAELAAGLTILGATLGAGQYALDFAMLAAARIDPAVAGEQFLTALREDAFVQWAFYRLPDVSQLGLILFTIALWRQGPGWRLQAGLVTVAAGAFLLGPLALGSTGTRIALGLMFAGFATVAWKIARRPTAYPSVPAASP